MSDTPQMNQEQLAELLDGRSDDEINEAIKAVGVENVLDQIFDVMQERFDPEKAAGQSAVIQWDITDPEKTHSYQVRVADGSCEVHKDTGETPRVTLGLTLPNFLRFVSGKLDGMQAFMGGQLKLAGDIMFAQTLQSWFRTQA